MNKSTSVYKEIKNLAQLRDELKIQSHLFKLEMKEDWKKLEKDWKTINRQLSSAKAEVKKSKSDIKTSTRQLVQTVKTGYKKIKQSIPKNLPS